MFIDSMDYLTEELEQLCSEMMAAYKDGDVECPSCWSEEFVSRYKTQYASELFQLTRENPEPTVAALMQTQMLIAAQAVLLNELWDQVELLHPELIEKN